MQAFIKDRKTFVTKALCLVLDYELKESIYDTVSNIVVETPANLPDEGDIVYVETSPSFFGVIETITPDFGKTTLSVYQIISLFSRGMFYESATFTYLEDYLAALISANYTDQPDTFYALPYLTATAKTHTPSGMLPDVENGVFSIKSYAAKMRRLYRIFLEWTLTRDALTVDIEQRTLPVKNIDMDNPSFVLSEQTFSVKSISKITTYAEDTQEYTDWILLNNGDIVNTASTTNRVDGEWITMTVPTAAEAETAVQDEFLKNEYAHKIIFLANIKYGFWLYDPLLIRLNGRLYNSYITGITTRKNSDIATIECGELQTRYPFLKLQ